MPPANYPFRPAWPTGDLYVSLRGASGKYSGLLPEMNGHESDGPLPTLAAALDRLRQWPPTGPVTIWLDEGTHVLEEPLVLGPDLPALTVAARPGKAAILSGGRRVTGFAEATLDTPAGRRRAWRVTLPGVARGEWFFRSLYVGPADTAGEPRPRPRWPKSGVFRIASVPGMTFTGFIGPPEAHHTTFYCEPGQVRAWKNLADVDAVAVHYWIEERLPLAAVDPATGRVDTAVKPYYPLKDDAAARCARVWFENVAEALSEPGEWYLDRATGELTYLPRDGETLDATAVFAPVLDHLIRIEGTPDTPARGLVFKNLTLAHADWRHVPGRGADSQASYTVPAIVQVRHARQCALEDCRVGPAGPYGVHIGPGCRGNRIVNTAFTHLGAGGIKVMPDPVNVETSPGVFAPADQDRVSHTLIENCEIAHCTGVFPSAIGVLIVHADHTVLRRNHIHHLEYSGVSCGWTWGFADAPPATHHTLIVDNHIHHIGSGLLNDMGGVYTLGEQPGTVIANNHIHDVLAENYGGWAVYLDEGSSHIVVENNLLHHTSSECLNLHYGRENIIRNNVLAFSGLGVLSISAASPHYNSLTVERNILLSDGKPVLVARDTDTLAQRGFLSDLNCLWDLRGPVYAGDEVRDELSRVTWKKYDLAALQALGYDRHSVAADPRFADPVSKDFTLSPESPAFALGFMPFTAAGTKVG